MGGAWRATHKETVGWRRMKGKPLRAGVSYEHHPQSYFSPWSATTPAHPDASTPPARRVTMETKARLHPRSVGMCGMFSCSGPQFPHHDKETLT